MSKHQNSSETSNEKSDTEQHLLARHREALREHFPLPSAEELVPRQQKKKVTTVLLLAGALGLLWFDPSYRTQQFSTAVGERQQVALQDGSQVTLNTDSRLDIEWHLRSRRAVLVKGQVLFDIERSHRPFEVVAGGTAVRVLGTAFDVHRDGHDALVTVLRGSVAVTAGGERVMLGPDQSIASHNDQLTPLKPVDAVANVAWKDGQLIFSRTPLREVLAELQRYTTTPLTTAPQLGTLPVSGVFNIDQSAALLELLPQILPVALDRTPDGGIRVIPAR